MGPASPCGISPQCSGTGATRRLPRPQTPILTRPNSTTCHRRSCRLPRRGTACRQLSRRARASSQRTSRHGSRPSPAQRGTLVPTAIGALRWSRACRTSPAGVMRRRAVLLGLSFPQFTRSLAPPSQVRQRTRGPKPLWTRTSLLAMRK